MDAKVRYIADYSHGLSFSELSRETVRHCKRCLLDSFGVALGAFDAEPSQIGRAIALRANLSEGARIIGTNHRTLPELAAFANGIMIRYLDGSDVYFSNGGGHPSDTISAVLAAADVSGADGKTLITATTLAYEVVYRLGMAARVRDKGQDPALYIAVGSALGASKVLGLDADRIAEAISLSLTPNIALVATRYGLLSMWKGCAGANAARNGVFAALLASAGMTGPEKPFEGAHGLENMVGTFELMPFTADRITEITLKCFISEGHTLSPITAALELSRQIKAADIRQITVFTYWTAWDRIGREPEKWNPTTREAADHSLPYIIAAVLTDGTFSDAIFSNKRLADPRIRELIHKVDVREDPSLTAQFPSCMPCRIEITSKTGTRIVASTQYPRGHHKNPMTDEEVNGKFRDIAGRKLTNERISNALEVLWKLEDIGNMDEVFEVLRIS